MTIQILSLDGHNIFNNFLKLRCITHFNKCKLCSSLIDCKTYIITFKGVVHFLKKTFADNLLTPMSSKMSMSFFLQSKRN